VIGKVVKVETSQDCCDKKEQEGSNKQGNESETSTLAPGIGVTKQLFATTAFLDDEEPAKNKEKQEEQDDTSTSECSPNLLEDDDEKTVLDNPQYNPDVDGVIITQQLNNNEEGWWSICSVCTEFPCVWVQYFKHKMTKVAQPSCSPLVHRQRAFMHLATLSYGKLGYQNRFDLPQCVVEGVRKNWPALDGVYTTSGVE
jgi:hypothetical protein